MSPEIISARRVAELLHPVLSGEDRIPAGQPEGGLYQSAVLVPLIDGADGAELLYIRRSDELPDHSGQVSFPGGIWEPQDSNLFDTASRESAEEVGVDPKAVKRIGALATVTTLEKYLIQPYLSIWPDARYEPTSPREVLRVFRVPLAWLLAPDAESEVEVGVARQRLIVPAFLHDNEVIWGATRRITLDLLRRLRAAL